MADERRKKEEEENAEISCGICLCPLFDEEFIPLEDCTDLFHKNCLAEYLKSEVYQPIFS